MSELLASIDPTIFFTVLGALGYAVIACIVAYREQR
jgi:hypothetical protein